jgi:hypothetical protein
MPGSTWSSAGPLGPRSTALSWHQRAVHLTVQPARIRDRLHDGDWMGA